MGGLPGADASSTLAVTFTPRAPRNLFGFVGLTINGNVDFQLVNLQGAGVGDVTSPTVVVTTPPTGASYLLNEVVKATYACQDEAGGVAPAVTTAAVAQQLACAAVDAERAELERLGFGRQHPGLRSF